MDMDLKRYESVTSREAFKKMLDGQRAYFINGVGSVTTYFFDASNRLHGETEAGEVFKVDVPADEILNRYNWYVKKPFDVRAEMLARPNEWVGVYKDESEIWNKVGFCTTYMNVRETSDFEHDSFEKTFICLIDDFNKCIPIEDVPKEELT